jgi:hypothetical protein
MLDIGLCQFVLGWGQFDGRLVYFNRTLNHICRVQSALFIVRLRGRFQIYIRMSYFDIT